MMRSSFLHILRQLTVIWKNENTLKSSGNPCGTGFRSLQNPFDGYGYRDSWHKSSAAFDCLLVSRYRPLSAFPDCKTSKISGWERYLGLVLGW